MIVKVSLECVTHVADSRCHKCFRLFFHGRDSGGRFLFLAFDIIAVFVAVFWMANLGNGKDFYDSGYH